MSCGVMPKRAAVAAIVLNHGLQAAVLLVAAHIGDDRNGLQLLDHLGGKPIEIVQIVALHGELILGVALPAADAQILRGLQIQRGAGHLGQLRPQPRDDRGRPRFSARSRGFSEMNRRAVLYVLPPVNPFTVSTAGSAATILIIGSMILSMAWNEVSWSA